MKPKVIRLLFDLFDVISKKRMSSQYSKRYQEDSASKTKGKRKPLHPSMFLLILKRDLVPFEFNGFMEDSASAEERTVENTMPHHVCIGSDVVICFHRFLANVPK